MLPYAAAAILIIYAAALRHADIFFIARLRHAFATLRRRRRFSLRHFAAFIFFSPLRFVITLTC
jgi:hypothetical protein